MNLAQFVHYVDDIPPPLKKVRECPVHVGKAESRFRRKGSSAMMQTAGQTGIPSFEREFGPLLVFPDWEDLLGAGGPNVGPFFRDGYLYKVQALRGPWASRGLGAARRLGG